MASPAQALNKWKQKKTGDITLPSGVNVKIEIPDLPEMLREGTVPNELVKFAVEAEKGLQGDAIEDEFNLEKVKEATDFMRWVVSVTVKEPVLTPEDVPELPALDTDMILEFAMRRRQVDAVGHQLFGMETIDKWRKFHFERI